MVEGFVKTLFNTCSSVKYIRQVMVPNIINALSNLVASLQGDGTGLSAEMFGFESHSLPLSTKVRTPAVL